MGSKLCSVTQTRTEHGQRGDDAAVPVFRIHHFESLRDRRGVVEPVCRGVAGIVVGAHGIDLPQLLLPWFRQRRNVEPMPFRGVTELDAEATRDGDDSETAFGRIDSAAAGIGDVDLLLGCRGPVGTVLAKNRIEDLVFTCQAGRMALGGACADC